MVSSRPSPLADVLARNEKGIYEEWITAQLRSAGARSDLITEKELREQSREFLQRLREAAGTAAPDGDGPAWEPVRELLAGISRARARKGFSSSETATFVFSLKEPIFTRLRQELSRDADALGEATWAASTLIDRLGLYTTEVYQKGREEIIVEISKSAHLNRTATLADVGNVACFVASDKAGAITDATVNISAGAIVDY